LAEYVRRVRQEKGFSTPDVERNSGNQITDGYVSQIENEYVKNVSPAKLKALAKGLQVNEDEIFAVARGQTTVGELTFDEGRILQSFRSLSPDRRRIALDVMESLNKGQGEGGPHPAVVKDAGDESVLFETTRQLKEQRNDQPTSGKRAPAKRGDKSGPKKARR
jgi:transcriptional regulator with XRE-family HTH domain